MRRAVACPECGSPYAWGRPTCDHPVYEKRRVHLAGIDTLYDTYEDCDNPECGHHVVIFIPAEHKWTPPES